MDVGVVGPGDVRHCRIVLRNRAHHKMDLKGESATRLDLNRKPVKNRSKIHCRNRQRLA